MPIFSPEEEERDDLLNSISIFFPPRRQTNWCVSLKLIFHPFIYCSQTFSAILDFPTKPLYVCDAAWPHVSSLFSPIFCQFSLFTAQSDIIRNYPSPLPTCHILYRWKLLRLSLLIFISSHIIHSAPHRIKNIKNGKYISRGFSNVQRKYPFLYEETKEICEIWFMC